ncbi:MAG TPA: hypothetical protein VNL92_00390, partial [Dehalococcoidia bacterium]|nr:hypothetical protein [Dehalococcoidia bacterium]
MGRMLFRRHPFRLSAIVAVLLAGLVLAACNSDGTAESGGTAVASPIGQEEADRALRGLCEARDLAGREDVEAARNVFFDEAHQFLHELTVPLQERDAAAARDLLVAKN